MWYIFEDRVGNYELAKVVNSKVEDAALRTAPSPSGSDYDKWFFDNTKPKLTIRNKSIEPNNLTSTQASADLLVAKNNGYVPYYDDTSKTIWINTSYDPTIRDEYSLNSNTGFGTTHHVENASDDRLYMPFVDLQVEELTGIRAFVWSNSATAPAITAVKSDGNTQGDSGDNKWYAGFGAGRTNIDIGSTEYTYYESKRDSANAYFSYTASSSSYKGKYSGTKVNTIIPQSKLSESQAKQLYLHVMDWTGNISSYHMGSVGVKFRLDATPPAVKSDACEGVLVADQYYIKKDYS